MFSILSQSSTNQDIVQRIMKTRDFLIKYLSDIRRELTECGGTKYNQFPLRKVRCEDLVLTGLKDVPDGERWGGAVKIIAGDYP